MNIIIGIAMTLAIATSTNAMCPETTTWSYYSYGSDTVTVQETTDWEALNKIKRKPGITPDPSMQAWYAQLGKERKVAQRVFELIDIYRMTEDEKTCVLNCLKYHSNRTNLYPIKRRD